jgi:putative flippase GtrA
VRVGRALTSGRLPVNELRRQLGRGAPERPDAEVSGVPRGLPGQLVRFAAIGVASTLAYLVLYALLCEALGAFEANLVALVVTAVANTAANRRLTFGLRGRHGAAVHQVQGLVVFGLGLALTSGALAALAAWAPDAGRLVEMIVLVVANATATVLRFVAFRSWAEFARA